MVSLEVRAWWLHVVPLVFVLHYSLPPGGEDVCTSLLGNSHVIHHYIQSLVEARNQLGIIEWHTQGIVPGRHSVLMATVQEQPSIPWKWQTEKLICFLLCSFTNSSLCPFLFVWSCHLPPALSCIPSPFDCPWHRLHKSCALCTPLPPFVILISVFPPLFLVHTRPSQIDFIWFILFLSSHSHLFYQLFQPT